MIIFLHEVQMMYYSMRVHDGGKGFNLLLTIMGARAAGGGREKSLIGGLRITNREEGRNKK